MEINKMKKIYSLLFVSLFLFIGYSCDDGSLSHSDVYIPGPVEETDEDDGFSANRLPKLSLKYSSGMDTSIRLLMVSDVLLPNGHTAYGTTCNVKM